MAKEFIVAIELGSSKITGIAGKKNLDGSITVLSVVKEDSTLCIRKGVVYNIDKTVQCLTNIVNKLETNLKSKIAHVYVGVGGQSIRSVKNIIAKDLPADTIVSVDMINELMDANRNMTYTDQEILDAATQEYKVDNQYQLDPVGIQCTRLEGNFLNILWRKAYYRNLNKCFDNAGIAIAEMYLAPLALADNVLTEAEKRSGCALIDFGAETTTISVYFKNILRHLAVIPLGSNNITKDIATLQIEEKDAEMMKLKYASAYTDSNEIDNTLTLPIDPDRTIESRKFIDIVEARLEEIIENAWFQIPNEFTDKLLGGIILTGGGSNMKNIDRAFRNYTHIEKIRIAKFVTPTINAKSEDMTAHDGTMNTVLGLLSKGDMNCAGNEITGDLFSTTEPKPNVTTAELHKTPRPINETIGRGVVQTEAEKLMAEEEARKKKEAEEEEARKAEQLRAEQMEEEKKKKENSFWHKMFKGAKEFGKKMIQEDE
jgi:cell division protein FtsA